MLGIVNLDRIASIQTPQICHVLSIVGSGETRSHRLLSRRLSLIILALDRLSEYFVAHCWTEWMILSDLVGRVLITRRVEVS